MGDHIVNERNGSHHYAPVKAQLPFGVAASPTLFLLAQQHRCGTQTKALRVNLDPLGEPALRLRAIPSNHRAPYERLTSLPKLAAWEYDGEGSALKGSARLNNIG